MARKKLSEKINDLFRRCDWEKARTLLERALEADPEDHWLMTQLGVTFYEQRRYEEALPFFMKAWKIVPDCPLTLWNLAGTMDALGNDAASERIYKWLLASNKTPTDDPCWESKEWADALKTDVVYRLGVFYQRRGKEQEAGHCYQNYLMLLSIGIGGTYSFEDVARRIQGLHDAGKRMAKSEALQKAIESTLQAAGVAPEDGHQAGPPEFTEQELLAACRGVS